MENQDERLEQIEAEHQIPRDDGFEDAAQLQADQARLEQIEVEWLTPPDCGQDDAEQLAYEQSMRNYIIDERELKRMRKKRTPHEH